MRSHNLVLLWREKRISLCSGNWCERAQVLFLWQKLRASRRLLSKDVWHLKWNNGRSCLQSAGVMQQNWGGWRGALQHRAIHRAAQRCCCMKGAYLQKLMQFSSFVTKRPGGKLYRNGTRWYKSTVQQRLKDTTSWNLGQSTMLQPEYTWPVPVRRRKRRRKWFKPCNSVFRSVSRNLDLAVLPSTQLAATACMSMICCVVLSWPVRKCTSIPILSSLWHILICSSYVYTVFQLKLMYVCIFMCPCACV